MILGGVLWLFGCGTPPAQTFGPNADWLIKVDEVIRQTAFPLELERFKQAAGLVGEEPESGGTTVDGRLYLDFVLRETHGTPERFEIRCYYSLPNGERGPRIVVAAELAYWDAKVYRYRLLRDVN